MTQVKQIISGGIVGLVLGKHGFMMYNENDQYIGRSIKHYGEFSDGEVDLFNRLISAGDVAVEVGANIGAHTVALAKRVGRQGGLFAFEPQYSVYQILCGNLALNGLSHARCYLAACGATQGEIVVPVLDINRVTNFGGLALGQYQKGDRVSVLTVDALGLSKCNLLKVDVEGMELQVLQGARQTIDRCRPYLYVENDREEHSAALIEMIFQLGYRCYWHLPPMFNPKNYFGNADNIFSNIISINMLCIPIERQLPSSIRLRQVESPQSKWQAAAVPTKTEQPSFARPTTVEEWIEASKRALANGNKAQALAAVNEMPAININHYGGLWSLAGTAVASECFEVVVRALQLLLPLTPLEPTLHSNLGAAYGRLEQHEKAAECFRKALELSPEFADAHFNYSNAMREIGKLQDAINCCRQGLQLEPNSATGHFLLANALSDLGENEQSRFHYEKALQLEPGNAGAHKNLGVLLLRCGELEDGWREYEWRFKADKVPTPEARFPEPYWDGSPLNGRTLLLCGEQGLGDQIQFARYASVIDGNVVIQVHDRLVPLLKSQFPRVVGSSDPKPHFDVHAPMMSVPRLVATNLNNLPATVPYVNADADRIEHWRQRLSDIQGFRVGIAWQGSKLHKRDRMRSIPLDVLEPLSQLSSVRLVCLQKGDGHEQLDSCSWRSSIVDFTEEMDQDGAFIDTAAVIKNLDLVLSIDSAIAHLAGAMGHPTWLLVRSVCDWRWLMATDRSPWYPSIQIIRQPEIDNWYSLVPALVNRLQHITD
jgi:FkbM family methyltransferase